MQGSTVKIISYFSKDHLIAYFAYFIMIILLICLFDIEHLSSLV